MIDEDRVRGRGLALFAVLYALAAAFETHGAPLRVFHVTNPITVSKAICFGSALWLLLRPGSLPRFLLLCTVHATMIVVALPRTPNHWMLCLLVDASFLAAAIRLRLADGRLSASRLYQVATPLVRLELLALYFWAFFHKLNLDFLDRDVSCAAVQLFRLRMIFPFLPADAWLREAALYGTLAVEAAIPVLLALRRTRGLGVLVAVGFHFVLGFLYMGFSANLFAWFSLFLPAAWIAAVGARDALLRLGAAALAFGVVRGALWAAGVPLGWLPSGWLLYGFAALALFVPELVRTCVGARAGEGAFALPYPALAVLPLLALLNGANPYLGLKNVQSFAMFSNLRTEGGRSNHLLVPVSWQIADYQRDLVTILDSSDSVLEELTQRRRYIHFFSTVVHRTGHPVFDGPAPTWQLPYAALRARVKHYGREGRSDLRVRFRRNGEVVESEQAERDPELSRMPWLMEKFFLLRAVPEGDRGLCMW